MWSLKRTPFTWYTFGPRIFQTSLSGPGIKFGSFQNVPNIPSCPSHEQSLFSGELLCQHPSSTWLSAARRRRPIKTLRGHVAAATSRPRLGLHTKTPKYKYTQMQIHANTNTSKCKYICTIKTLPGHVAAASAGPRLGLHTKKRKYKYTQIQTHANTFTSKCKCMNTIKLLCSHVAAATATPRLWLKRSTFPKFTSKSKELYIKKNTIPYWLWICNFLVSSNCQPEKRQSFYSCLFSNVP